MFAKIKLKLTGIKIYILAFLLALPDILDGLGIVDWTTLFPANVGTRIATLLTIARIIATVTIRNAKKNDRKDLNDESDRR